MFIKEIRSDEYGALANVAVYSSLTDLEMHANKAGVTSNYSSSWAGKDLSEAFADCFHGVSDSETKAARDLMTKVNATFQETPRFKRKPHVSGGAFNVGAYMAGEPYCMRRRVKTYSESGLIKLVVETTVSGGFDAKQIARRGAAIVALAACLNQVRPVELWAAWGLGSGIHASIGMVKVPSTPLTISQAVAIMGTDSFARRIAFAEIHNIRNRHYGGWALGMPGEKRNAEFARVIGLTDKDVFIGGAYLTHKDTIENNPVKYIEDQLAKIPASGVT